MRLNVLGFDGAVTVSRLIDLELDAPEGALHDCWVEMPARSIGTSVRLGDWAVDAAGVAGPRPIETPLAGGSQLFASGGRMCVELTYTITR